MSPDRPHSEVIEMLDKFDLKLERSGYSQDRRQEIMVAGIRTFTNKLKYKTEGQIHTYRDMSDIQTRRIGKLSEKTMWMNRTKKK